MGYDGVIVMRWPFYIKGDKGTQNSENFTECGVSRTLRIIKSVARRQETLLLAHCPHHKQQLFLQIKNWFFVSNLFHKILKNFHYLTKMMNKINSYRETTSTHAKMTPKFFKGVSWNCFFIIVLVPSWNLFS